MKTKEEVEEQARKIAELRRAGHSRREIKEILGFTSNATMDRALRGEPPPTWTQRPRAKDDLHAKAREMRAQGSSMREIAAALGVSKGSVSLWTHDQPRTGRISYEEGRKRCADGARRYWEAERPAREAERAAIRAAAAAQTRGISGRELLIAGAIAYWCEGTKSKPHRPSERVSFINSDPQLIKLFLQFLAAAGVPPDHLSFYVLIHESADVAAAHRFWLAVTGADRSRFRKPVLKRHNPKTVRKNVGDEYHGCLRVDALRSPGLYRRIEGWVAGALADLEAATLDG